MANGNDIPWNTSSWEEALGSTIQDYYSPEQQFAQFRTTIRPSWQYRAPLQDMQSRLQARWLLGAPTFAHQGYNFRDYLGDLPAAQPTDAAAFSGFGYPQDYATLRARATEAARIGGLTPEQLYAEYSPGDSDFNRVAWYRQMFGQPTGESIANQRAVANLLALQRRDASNQAIPGARAYSGRMGSAITNMMNELYQARSAAGEPQSSFLKWYLARSG